MDRPRDPLPTRVDLCPPLSDAYDHALESGLAGLGIQLTGETRYAIDGHVRLLLAWNAAINLTAIRDPVAIAIRHVIDSLTALAVLRGRHVDRFIDLGSGGGFPGIPLAAALPADRALLIDSIGKKVRFLATVVDAVGLGDRVAAEPARAESLAATRADRGRWPAVLARAVGPLPELIELAFPLLQPGGVLVAWKRRSPDDPLAFEDELAAARRAMGVIDPESRIAVETPIGATFAPAHLADLADHRLVTVARGTAPIAATWPRDPATRRRHPW